MESVCEPIRECHIIESLLDMMQSQFKCNLREICEMSQLSNIWILHIDKL